MLASGTQGVIADTMPPRKDKELKDSAAWLTRHGVAKKRVKAFLETSGCTSLDSVALYLRLQLSPLDLANTDCINLEMSELMGVTGKRARKIIKDLNVFGTTPDRLAPFRRITEFVAEASRNEQHAADV